LSHFFAFIHSSYHLSITIFIFGFEKFLLVPCVLLAQPIVQNVISSDGALCTYGHAATLTVEAIKKQIDLVTAVPIKRVTRSDVSPSVLVAF
jgi:hypothetical protein